MTDPFATVIVPCYNVEGYIAACLESLLAQTSGDFEAICIDDGSTDGTAAVLRDYAGRDGRIRIVSQENAGVSAARNAGLGLARGKFVLFVDGDDLLEPDAVETVARASGASGGLREARQGDGAPVDIVVFGGTTFPTVRWMDDALATRDAVRPAGPDDDAFKTLFTEKGCVPFVWNKAYRADLIERVGARFDEALAVGEDNAFACSVFPEAESVRFVDAKLYRYRTGREGSATELSSADLRKKLDGQVGIVESVLRAWEGRGYPESAYAGLLQAQLFLFNDERRLDAEGTVSFCRNLCDRLSGHLNAANVAAMPSRWARARYRYYMNVAAWSAAMPPKAAVRKAKAASFADLARLR